MPNNEEDDTEARFSDINNHLENILSMNQQLENKIKDIPKIITSPFEMKSPNQTISVFKGTFTIMKGNKPIKIDGEIYYQWFPNAEVKFSGTVTEDSEDFFGFSIADDKYKIVLNGFDFGNAFLQNISTSQEQTVEGIILGEATVGDKTIPVSKISFAIPNCRDFFGNPVKIETDTSSGISRNRLRFENEEYIIIIDKSNNFKNLNKELSDNGGFVLLYFGELTKKKGDIQFNELNEIIYCFSTFLTFLNGRRCSPVFLQGMHENNIIWTDYSSYITDQYVAVCSWVPKHSIECLDEIWIVFSDLWKNSNDRDFLISAIHWYVEANMNSGYIEGSIIMSQVALELIYNWLVIEKKRLLIGKDSESISASNKIRLLLSQINGNSQTPETFKDLKAFIKSNNEIIDGVEAFVQIRNALIHSQEEKRKKLTKISSGVKYEVKQLAIWYIELSLLYIFKYRGKYYNRCSGKLWAGEGEEISPYSKCSIL